MNHRIKAGIHYIRRTFDEAAILAIAAKLAFDPDPHFSESELAVIAAMQRAHPSAGGDPKTLGHWLAEMNERQIEGVISNTKGVLHEMEFVRIENEDGDSVHAALYPDTNHPDTDVVFVDDATGLSWDVQLKATSDVSYVQDWIDSHPDGHIVVTSELAERMGLSDSQMTDNELTFRTEHVVDRLVDTDPHSDIWHYFPSLSAVSLSLVVWSLGQRYRAGEISFDRFKWMLAQATGWKIAKIGLLTLAMSIPGLNIATGAMLVARMMFSGAGMAKALSRSGARRRSNDGLACATAAPTSR
jgi:hypothetical protein